MRHLWLSLALFCVFARSGAPEQIGSLIQTPIDQWRPVRPGTWTITSARSDSRPGQSPAVTKTLACPYSALLFLNNVASIKVGESGCRYDTYKVSDHLYHIAVRCAVLRSRDHFETTTLQVSGDGRQFTAVTTWSTPSGSVTLQRAGEFKEDCKAN